MNGFFIGFAIALLLWFAAFLFLKNFVRNRTSPDFILDKLQEEVIQLEADIDAKTEQNLQLLEEKIRSLREMCNEAERRIAVYNRELEKHENETKALAALNKKPLVERLEVEPRNPDQVVRPPVTSVEQAAASKSSPPVTSAERATASEGSPPVTKPLNITLSHEKISIKPRPVKERIAELQKAGFAPELIAKRLGINLGEVQFYFNLAGKSEP